MEKKRIIICGDRNWTNEVSIVNLLKTFDPSGTIIIHGAARGADTIAAVRAACMRFEVKGFPADWKTFGRAAGPIRNREMLKLNPHEVHAFHEFIENSKGTKDMVAAARKAGVPTFIHKE